MCKSKQPQGKRFDCLVLALKDPLIKAKFKLVEYVSMKLNCFLRGFQTDKPMIPEIRVGAKMVAMDYKKSKGFNENTLKKFYRVWNVSSNIDSTYA